jgi:hypothetical protein
MKQAFFLLLIAVPLLFSCKKETTTKSSTSTNLSTFTLKKDGVPYASNGVYLSLADENTIYFESYLNAFQQVQLNSYAGMIQRNAQPGTYQIIDGECPVFTMIHYDLDSNFYGLGNGSFTILSNDTINKVIEATFDLDMYNDEIDIYPVISEGELTFHYY